MDKLVNEKVEDTLHIYLRVSSTAQIKEGFGIENQRKLGEKVAKGLGLIPKIWNEGDKSASSENIEERPILEELLNNVDDGIVKKVWAFANDRLSRNENIWNHIRIKLRTNECRLYIGEGSEQNLKNDLDDFIFGIMAEVSKYDQRLRTNRLRRGKFSKISKGGWKGGPTPFGYDNIDGFLEINKNEGKWVKRIYEEYSKGTSIYAIKQLLMRNGVLSRRGNVVWSDQSIRVILTNTYYEGFWTYYDKVLKQNIRNDCQRLIPSNIIKKVRKRFEETTTTSNYIKYD